jgi:MFS family permease
MTRVRLGANYVRLWAASTVSNLGDGVTLAALPLLAASLTRSPTSVAAVSFAGTLPWLFFALLGGAVADRVDRKRAMAVVDGLRMVTIGILAALVLTDEASLILIGIVAFTLGTLETVFDNAAQAILPNVVDRDALETANGRLYAAEVVTNQFAGPPLGAFLFTAAAAAPFVLDSASFGIAAIVVLGLRGSFRPVRKFTENEARPSIRADIAEGLRWLRRHRLLRTLALLLGVLNLLEAGVMAVLVLYALEVLDLSKTGYGILLTAAGIGALFGSLLARRLSSWMGPGTTLIVSVLLIGAATLVPALVANPIMVGASFAVIGAAAVAWNVVTVSLRQAIVPDALLGRVNSAYRLLGWGTMPLGALLGGFLAETFGLRAPFVVGGVVPLVMGVAMIPLVNNRTLAAARAGAERDPD